MNYQQKEQEQRCFFFCRRLANAATYIQGGIPSLSPPRLSPSPVCRLFLRCAKFSTSSSSIVPPGLRPSESARARPDPGGPARTLRAHKKNNNYIIVDEEITRRKIRRIASIYTLQPWLGISKTMFFPCSFSFFLQLFFEEVVRMV